MAIKPVPNRYKSFAFNGVNARTYGVYVTDVNVFNSAERAVDYVTIPGRNGAFALDHGRFENVTVKYSCAMGADSDTDFADAISDFRNILASAKGYQRLEDDMNPTEYRMAVFSKGIEAPTLNQQTATFDVEFSCKPQRFLKSGETAVSITSGDTITNPTLFDASPMLVIDGNGTVDINGDEIELGAAPIGNIVLASKSQSTGNMRTVTTALAHTDALNVNDTITVGAGSVVTFYIYPKTGNAVYGVSNASLTGTLAGTVNAEFVDIYVGRIDFTVIANTMPFINGTSNTLTSTLTADINWYVQGGAIYTTAISVTISATYDEFTQTIEFGATTVPTYTGFDFQTFECTLQEINGNSTKPALSGTTYIDLDIGEAYQLVNGAPISVNNAVFIPAKLPVLIPGTNTVTYDNTVTDMQIIPRWWRV